jgi:ribonuclease Y
MVVALVAGIIIALLIGLGIGFIFRNAQLKCSGR